jgi:hypothetical protein
VGEKWPNNNESGPIVSCVVMSMVYSSVRLSSGIGSESASLATVKRMALLIDGSIFQVSKVL